MATARRRKPPAKPRRGTNEVQIFKGLDGVTVVIDYNRWQATGRSEEATQLWRDAVAAGPEDLVARSSLAERIERDGRVDEAGELWLETAEALDTPVAWQLLAAFHRRQEQPAAAQAALARAMAAAGEESEFMRFVEEGTGYLALVDGTRLWIEVLPPERSAQRSGAQTVLLDERFPAGHDFVQDLTPLPDGGVLVTRWSGRIHRVQDGEVGSYVLPRQDPQGLYYTSVLAADHLCATFCGDVTVVCRRISNEQDSD